MSSLPYSLRRTISLADLINLKLNSGLSGVLRTQDLADVIALIRVNNLDGRFSSRISKSLRPKFRKLVVAVRDRKHKPSAEGGDRYSHQG